MFSPGFFVDFTQLVQHDEKPRLKERDKIFILRPLTTASKGRIFVFVAIKPRN